MNSLDPLSATIKTALASLGIDDAQIQAAAAGDVDAQGGFGQQWLLVTDAELLLLADDGSLLHRISRATIKSITAELLVGGGAIIVETPQRSLELLRYSNQCVGKFGYLARWLTAWIDFKAGKIKEEPVWDYKPDKYFCLKCGLPLPDEFSPCQGCTKNSQVLLRILSYLKPYRWRTALLAGFSLASVGLELMPPYFSKVLIDDVLLPPQTLAAHPATTTLGRIARSLGGGTVALSVAVTCLGAAYLLGTMLSIARGRMYAWLGMRLAADIRAQLFEGLHSLSIRFFDKRQTGTVISHVTQDTERLLGFLVEGMQLIARDGLMLIGVTIILLWMNWRLTLMLLIPLPAVYFGSRAFWKLVRGLFHRAWERHSRMHDVVNDAFSGVRVVRAFAQEDQSISRFRAISEEYRDYSIRVETYFATFMPVLQVCVGLAGVVVWFVGGRAVLEHYVDPNRGMTLGTVVTFMSYLGVFYGPVMNMGPLMSWASRSLTASERIFEVLDAEPEQLDDGSLVDMPDIRGDIVLKNLTFGYEAHKPVLKSVDLNVKAGEMIGLVGHSGAGKSTLINLLCRFYHADSGHLLIDGQDIRKIKLQNLRRQTGVVLQEPFLFNGSIAENIAFAKQGASMGEIVTAARAANAHEFITKLADGYDSEVGERGSRLSGGERQRISIARAVLHNPRILILDEATSSVDVKTEKQIQEAINRLVKNRTTLAIAHRLSTLRNANRLFVLKDGKGIECGTHDELMEKKGEYFNLVNTQRESSKMKGEAVAVEG